LTSSVRRACIDIGSNTTRLLVADCAGGRLAEVHQERAFTRVSRGLELGGTIAQAKMDEVARVVAGQLRTARELGATDVQTVATAAIRRARNGTTLTAAVEAVSGLEVKILTGEQEARLAFVGAAGTLEHPHGGVLGVVDVGGGSSELVVGRAPDVISWSTSFEVGSGDLVEEYLRSDPPSATELSLARKRIAGVLGGIVAPRPQAAVAVGGSATSLRRLVGEQLDEGAFRRTLELLASARSAAIAGRFALDQERVRLLPAGILILEAASELFGATLRIGRGGIREGLLLEAEG
jgi:exopolyphosphatase/guanosine-5'-triphosphate,3'-diphosphate pyrophosphatase